MFSILGGDAPVDQATGCAHTRQGARCTVRCLPYYEPLGGSARARGAAIDNILKQCRVNLIESDAVGSSCSRSCHARDHPGSDSG